MENNLVNPPKKVNYERTNGRRLLTICPRMGCLIGGGYCITECSCYRGKNMDEQYVYCTCGSEKTTRMTEAERSRKKAEYMKEYRKSHKR